MFLSQIFLVIYNIKVIDKIVIIYDILLVGDKMCNVKYIDKNTFEIRDDVFEVDDLIADTIILLNKKGYKTKYCCAGHNDKSIRTGLVNKQETEGDLLKRYDIDVITITKENEKFRIYFRPSSTDIYIMFDKDYLFKTLPKGFKKQGKWDKEKHDYSKTEFDTITMTLSYFNGHTRKTDEAIKEDIKLNNHLLYEWVKSLPDNYIVKDQK